MGLFRVFLGIEGEPGDFGSTGERPESRGQREGLAILGKRRLHICFNLLCSIPIRPWTTSAPTRILARHRTTDELLPHGGLRGTPLEARLRRQGRLLGDMWGLTT